LQEWLQLPQCFGSLAGLTHPAAAQFTSPVAQLVLPPAPLHCPFTHVCPALQEWPQLPQCFGSLAGLAHPPAPQFTSPAAQLAEACAHARSGTSKKTNAITNPARIVQRPFAGTT